MEAEENEYSDAYFLENCVLSFADLSGFLELTAQQDMLKFEAGLLPFQDLKRRIKGMTTP